MWSSELWIWFVHFWFVKKYQPKSMTFDIWTIWSPAIRIFLPFCLSFLFFCLPIKEAFIWINYAKNLKLENEISYPLFTQKLKCIILLFSRTVFSDLRVHGRFEGLASLSKTSFSFLEVSCFEDSVIISVRSWIYVIIFLSCSFTPSTSWKVGYVYQSWIL